jgi:hypothetical protein
MARQALRPPQTFARHPDPKRQAAVALVDLLTAALDRHDAAQPRSPSHLTCWRLGWFDA